MKFLISKWIQKVIRTGIQALIAWIGAEQLATWGITLDVAQLTAASYVALEAVRNFIKHKWGVKWL